MINLQVALVLLLASFHFDTTLQERDNESTEKIVKTKNGPLVGQIVSTRQPHVKFVTFQGIRYASPAKRFERATPFEDKWTQPKPAKFNGSNCLQQFYGGSEDCFFLNVNVPLEHFENPSVLNKPLPVLFWVHGGGFGQGEGHTYTATYLLENQDLILVTTNYRLGILGFISMEEESVFTANNGLRDILLALQWVQQNIAQFGGNPNKVTLAGESAGGAAVHYLLMSPLASGLFQQAIIQSGAFTPFLYMAKPKLTAGKFAKALGCEDAENATRVRKCLETVPGHVLITTQNNFYKRWPDSNCIPRFLPTAKESGPTPFFPSAPSSFFTFPGRKTRYVSKVPVLIGVTRDEGSTLFGTAIADMEGALHQLDAYWKDTVSEVVGYEDFFPKEGFPEVAKRLRQFYYANTPVSRDNLEPLARLSTDFLMLLPVFQAAEDMAKQGFPVYPYIFSFYGKHYGFENLRFSRIPGMVGHADDLAYLFPHPVFASPLEPNSEEEGFSKRFVKVWSHFVKTGVPGKFWEPRGRLNWEPIKLQNGSVGNFKIVQLDTHPSTLSSKEIQKRLRFWRKTLKSAWTAEENKR